MNKVSRYLTKNETRRYVEALPELVASYNATYHKSTGFAPNRIDESKTEAVWEKLYEKGFKSKKIRNKNVPEALRVGLFVRIPKEKKVFYKGYKTRWTTEIFKIKKINIGSPTTYDLKDLNGEDIKGTFYRQELNPVPKP